MVIIPGMYARVSAFMNPSNYFWLYGIVVISAWVGLRTMGRATGVLNFVVCNESELSRFNKTGNCEVR